MIVDEVIDDVSAERITRGWAYVVNVCGPTKAFV